jgi:transcriptional regulator with XRE-family HTH domain
MESFRVIGERLRAHRLFLKMSADEVAQAIGVSRALLHRYEAGHIVKLETLERFARVYNLSPSALLGLGTEYLTDGVKFFERVASLEKIADRMTVVFGPLVYVLSSNGYDRVLRRTLQDPQNADPVGEDECRRLLEILESRKAVFRYRQPAVVNILPLDTIERYLGQGLAISGDKPYAERAALRREAVQEIAHLAALIGAPPMHVQIALTPSPLPTAGYQILHCQGRRFLVNSPFRVGQPLNIRYGVATITEDREALEKHDRLTNTLWDGALKGADAVRELERLIKKYAD